MDPQDRIPGRRSQRLLGSARLLELSGTVVQRPLRDGLDVFGIRDLGFGIRDGLGIRGLDFGGANPEPPNPRSPESRIPNPESRVGTEYEPRPCMRVWPGEQYPLGANWTGVGGNFAVSPRYADR